jgi:hypothetical protein
MSIAVAERVTEVPRIYETGNKSTACLLKEIGFPSQSITVDEVENVLKHNPQLADLWLKRSRDQRIACGWSIEQDQDVYRIHRFAGSGFASGRPLELHDRIRACAEFIVRYVSFIGDVMVRNR